jgi:uncharacterized protein YxjI
MASFLPYRPPIGPPSLSIAVRQDSVSDIEQTIYIQQHDRYFKRTTIVDSEGKLILEIDGKIKSATGRRQFSDPSGLRLFDLRTKMFSLRKPWTLELPDSPDGADDLISARVPWSSSWTKIEMEIKVRNIMAGGEIAMLTVKPLDVGRLVSLVWHEEKPIARIHRIFDDVRSHHSHGSDEHPIRAAWEAKFAPGLDLHVVRS